jgi:hypothetical protein
MDTSFIDYFLYPLLSLVIATLIGGEIVRKLYSPKVKVKVKSSNYLKNKDGYLIALNIVNLGSSAATKCMSYLVIDKKTAINKEDLITEHDACENEYLPTYTDENIDYTIPRQQWITPEKYVAPEQLVLCWNHAGDPYQLDINPGVTVSLNICRLRYHEENKYWYMIFPTEKGWRRVRFRMRFKPLHGKIFICPSNAFPLIVKFKIINSCPQGEPILEVNRKPINAFQRRKILSEF